MSETQKNTSTTVERIIAKIDNDFNPDNSDWIPRVGAWCIDAMSQIDCLRTKRKKKKLTVKDRIAYSDVELDTSNMKVYDENCCEVKEAENCDCGGVNGCGCGSSSSSDESSEDEDESPFTGESTSEASTSNTKEFTPDTIDRVNTSNKQLYSSYAETVNDKTPYRWNVYNNASSSCSQGEHNYCVVDCDKLELNWDAKYIYVETEQVETKCSEQFGCELPVIPNNGLLIEALAYYCVYKMLCRGYKHPVFNLQASQYGTNPYYIWTQLKNEAKRSVRSGNVDDASKLFRSAFFIQTFDPR